MATEAQPTHSELPNGRPVVFAVRDAFVGVVGYGVAVRVGGSSTSVTTFATADAAWERGVELLADMLEAA